MIGKSVIPLLCRAALLVGLLHCMGCSREEPAGEKAGMPADPVETGSLPAPASACREGSVRIRVSEAFAEKLEIQTDAEGRLLATNVRSVNDAISSLGIARIERTFPYAGKYEGRTRREGLHLWYDVHFDENCPLTRAGAALEAIEGVDYVEYLPEIIRIGGTRVETEEEGDAPETRADLPFNDPKLSRQWHYFNDGSISRKAVAGADIHVLPLWQFGITGSPEVIVCVVDEGVDYRHEDLAENMWTNPEEEGKGGHGYNCVRRNYRIDPGEHGTHVAGTIAAVNNNGKGCCGIAGGDRAKGRPGARIMSCQIFDGDFQGGGALGIKWGADHGAVIAQNSWGYGPGIGKIQPSDKAAIDYFNKYAGCDDNGDQLPDSPMKGGVCIFAAGNDNLGIGYPATYEGTFSVASIGFDYKRAPYSNYGKWVDVAAPGGDETKGTSILSTVPGNKYATMQGTSMACPHVSGVAALIVSKYGGPGFTADELRRRLRVTANPVIYEYNPDYTENLGAGLVDAFKAVMTGSNIVTDLSVQPRSDYAWCSFSVPADQDYQKAEKVRIYYSTRPLDETSIPGCAFLEVALGKAVFGEQVTVRLSGLEKHTAYYFTATSIDRAGKESAPGNVVHAATDNYPEITREEPLRETIRQYEDREFPVEACEPDGGRLSARLEPEISGLSLSLTEKGGGRYNVGLRIQGVKMAPGTYKSTLVVFNDKGLTASLDFKITVLENLPPKIVGRMDDLLFDGCDAEPLSLDAGKYFADEDGEPLHYGFEVSEDGVAGIRYENGHILLTPEKIGSAQVTVTAEDAMKAQVAQTFQVVVRDDRYPMDVYPNPVTELLHVRLPLPCAPRISLLSSSGAEVFSGKFETSFFRPVILDVRALPGGVYTVVARYADPDGKTVEIHTKIVKL